MLQISDSLSLTCDKYQQREIFKTDKMYIATPELSETMTNISFEECSVLCQVNSINCIAIEVDNDTCTSFLSDGYQLLQEVQTDSTAAVAICWEGIILSLRPLFLCP